MDVCATNVTNSGQRSTDSPHGDCYAVPRGGGLLNVKTREGMIYHGNGTSAETLSQIAQLYGLAKWSANVDEHYLVGAAADNLFDEWDNAE